MIRFVCRNPSCHTEIDVPADAAGAAYSCPVCGTEQTVPDRSVSQGVLDGAGGGLFPQSKREQYRPPPEPEPAPLPKDGAFAWDCLRSVRYGLGSFTSAMGIMLVVFGMYLVARLCLTFLAWLVTAMPLGLVLVAGVSGAVFYMFCGYIFRFLLDTCLSAMLREDRPPEMPGVRCGEMFVTGMRAVGVLLVYGYAIITLPLLPLGFLAASYSDDVRAFDVRWAIRAARRCPGRLAVLWLFLLAFLAIMLGAGWGVELASAALRRVVRAAGDDFTGEIYATGVLVLSMVVQVAIACVLAGAMFRSIGMLGRHQPEVLEELPEKDDYLAVAICVAGALVVGTVLRRVLAWAGIL